MSKERDIEILTYKIEDTKKKIENFQKYGISEKKIKDLEVMLMKYEDQLAEIQLG